MLQSNKEAARKFLEYLGNADGEALGSLLADDCYADCTGTSIVSKIRHRSEMIRSCNYFKRTMKNGIRFEILNMTAEDDRVAVEAEGISELLNGVAYNNQYHFLFFFRDGKISKLREYLGSRLDQSQKATAAARLTADRKFLASLS